MEKAVVIGGGGITGMAWEAGILAGLMEKGIKVDRADKVVGTSAGSFIGSLLVNQYNMKEYYQYLAANKDEKDQASLPESLYKQWVDAVVEGGEDEEKVGRLFGKVAEDFAPIITPSERRKAVEVRLKNSQWQPQLHITALDTESGKLRVFNQNDGISLIEAVTASGAVPGLWPAVEYEGHKYTDGGFVNSANAKVVKDANHIIIIAPLPEKQGKLRSVIEDVEILKQTKTVTLITPNKESKAIIGNNIYDASRLEEIGDVGFQQGLQEADKINVIWK